MNQHVTQHKRLRRKYATRITYNKIIYINRTIRKNNVKYYYEAEKYNQQSTNFDVIEY